MSNLSNKDVSYLGRDFSSLRSNLIDFAKNYFPQTYQDFNEASPGMMFMEMAAYVGDVLSYYTDHNLRESNLATAEETKNIYALAQTFGYKNRNTVAASVDMDVYQIVPAIGSSPNIKPDWNYAFTVETGMTVNGESVFFRTTEPVDFTYSSSLSPTEVTVYQVNDSTKEPEWYLLRKTVKAVSGDIKTQTFTFESPKIYDKVTISDSNLIEVIDIVDSDNNVWNEVPYLAQETVFESITNSVKNDPNLPQYRDSVPYLLKLKKTSRRFITRFKDRDRMEIQFGAGVSDNADEELIPNPDLVGTALPGRDRDIDLGIDPSNFLYTKTYGVAPANTTLTVRYTVGQGVADNVPANTITGVGPNEILLNETGLDVTLVKQVKSSLAVTNPKPAVGGATKEALEDIRNNALANFASQNRAVTKEDYMVRAYSMPPRFGAVAKAYIAQDDQLAVHDDSRDRVPNPYAMNMYLLGFDNDGKLTQLNPAIKENLKTYLTSYRILTDGINIKDAYIINLGVDFEIVALPDYNANEVVLRCIDKLKSLFDVKQWQVNQPIMVSRIRVELDKVKGVQTVNKVEFTNKFDATKGYSGNIYDINSALLGDVLYPSMDPSIFEVKYPNQDIRGRAVAI